MRCCAGFANPWTGADNDVIHVANDPVNQRPSFGRSAEGEDIPFDLHDINGNWLMRIEVPLFYTNPMGGDYQNYIGGTYHATEIFDFNGDTGELLDADSPVAYPVVSWVRLAPWLPWLEMGNRPGMMYFNAMGRKLEDAGQLSPTMQAEIAENYPAYTAPPGLDDNRPQRDFLDLHEENHRRSRPMKLRFAAMLAVWLTAGATLADTVPDDERVPLDLRRTTLVVNDIERSLAFLPRCHWNGGDLRQHDPDPRRRRASRKPTSPGAWYSCGRTMISSAYSACCSTSSR